MVEFVVSDSEDKLLKGGYAAYFKDSAAWLASRLGGYIHRDEDVPNMHVLVMPLVDGKLCYSRFLGGNKYQLQKFQTDFAKEIAKAYGLVRGIMNSGTKKQWTSPELVDIKLSLSQTNRGREYWRTLKVVYGGY